MKLSIVSLMLVLFLAHSLSAAITPAWTGAEGSIHAEWPLDGFGSDISNNFPASPVTWNAIPYPGATLSDVEPLLELDTLDNWAGASTFIYSTEPNASMFLTIPNYNTLKPHKCVWLEIVALGGGECDQISDRKFE